MRIIITMTADAGRCGLPVLLAVRVTAVAGDFLMCTVEDEVGQRMIERGCYQLDDDLVPALVLHVLVVHLY